MLWSNLNSSRRLGSWDGHIRLWKVDPKMKSFSAVGSFSVQGVINSLQVVSPLKGSLADASWAWGQTGEDGPRIASGPSMKQKTGPVLLVAGVGQEPRLGRWVTMKGDGSRNCALVMALHPRTLT
jgi:ribosomal RNA-processing protein 9